MAKQALHGGAKASAGADQVQTEQTVLQASGRSVNDGVSERMGACMIAYFIPGFLIADVILHAYVWRSVLASCLA